MQCAELSRNELDLVILGQISALLPSSSQMNAHRSSTQRHRMAFYHHGVPVCRETFLKLHGIGKIGFKDMYSSQSVHCRTGSFQECEGKLFGFWFDHKDPWKHQTTTQECSIDEVKNTSSLFSTTMQRKMLFCYLAAFLGTNGTLFNCCRRVQPRRYSR